jgi:hypothetical protein
MNKATAKKEEGNVLVIASNLTPQAGDAQIFRALFGLFGPDTKVVHRPINQKTGEVE